MNDQERDALRRLLEAIELHVELADQRGLDVSLAADAATSKAAAILAASRGRVETAALLRDLAIQADGLPAEPGQLTELARMPPMGRV